MCIRDRTRSGYCPKRWGILLLVRRYRKDRLILKTTSYLCIHSLVDFTSETNFPIDFENLQLLIIPRIWTLFSSRLISPSLECCNEPASPPFPRSSDPRWSGSHRYSPHVVGKLARYSRNTYCDWAADSCSAQREGPRSQSLQTPQLSARAARS